jgi:hypothetical protein
MRLVIAVVVAAACACGTGDDGKVEAAKQQATAAMKAMREASPDFQAKFTTSLAEVESVALEAKTLPVIDAYLARSDAALTTADAYLALEPDPSLGPAMTKIRAGTKALHAARDSLAATVADAAAGKLTLEQLSSRLMALGMTLALQ